MARQRSPGACRRVRCTPFLLLLASWLAACGGSGGGGSDGPGALVGMFGVAGSIEVAGASYGTYASHVITDATHMYVGGWTDELGSGAWRVEKRALLDGGLDPAFGAGGALTINPSAGNDTLTALVRDDTHLYLGGFTNAPGDSWWRVERRSLVDGSLDPGFGAGGAVIENPTPGADSLRALLVAGSRLYVAITLDDAYRIECRSAATGALVDTFGVLGVLDIDPSPGYDSIDALVADGTSFFALGRDQTAGAGDWSIRVEKRSSSDGSLVAGFGVGGVLSSNVSATYDAVYDAAISDGWLYIAGTDEQAAGGNRRLHLEKRSVVDGSPDPAFGVGGLLASNPSSGDDEYLALTVRGGQIWLAGVDEVGGDGRWRLEKRLASSGALDASFGSGGVVLFNVSGLYDQAEDIAVASERLVAVGLVGDDGWRIEARQP